MVGSDAIQLTAEKSIVEHHQGPLPAPETLAGYEQTLAGLADRIVRMAEQESAHRRDMESRFLDAQINDGKLYRRIEMRGQIWAGVISIVGLGSGSLLTYLGHPNFGTAVIGGTLIGLASLFIYGRERKISEVKASRDMKAEKPSTDLMKEKA